LRVPGQARRVILTALALTAGTLPPGGPRRQDADAPGCHLPHCLDVEADHRRGPVTQLRLDLENAVMQAIVV